MNNLEEEIREFLSASPELLRPEYRGESHPLTGHCYVASEAYFHARGGFESDLTIWQMNHEGESHWFLRDSDGEVIDLTVEQFESPPDYETATRRGFLTRQPSKRAQTVLNILSLPDETASGPQYKSTSA